MTSTLGSEDKALRVAIIGGGPSGFYAADSLFKSQLNINVDIFEKLPTPYGLLRGGIAPDHQKMKSVASYYERVAVKNEDHFNYFGNIEVGKDITIQELQTYYDALIFSYGSESDKSLGIQGEDLQGSHSAREFVGWYNGHPEYTELNFDLSQDSAVVIGLGNVAIDVVRILAKTPKELASSDIVSYAQDALKDSQVKNIHMIGRRGPAQAAFTRLEIQELGELEDCDIVVHKKDLKLTEASITESEDPKNSKAKKNLEILYNLSEKTPVGKSKTIHIHFFKSPKVIKGEKMVESIDFDRNKLIGEPFKQKVAPTGIEETIDCGLVFRSIGYKGTPIAGVPFDEKAGIIPNKKGAVISEDHKPITGLFTSGWIKRGPSGVLGTNKSCSQETVETLLNTLNNLSEAPNRDSDDLLEELSNKGLDVVNFLDWKRLDSEEVLRGSQIGKPREKFTSIKDMIKFIGATCLV
ncbi:NADP oxidoreductase [Candidatus Marinamargulisbacteria bacterium SCGC AAA071-K20]|nr:NADP oxidoreductase [Candidatus Marinamargulisbacteria bacterium SCGC AAA071-K20]